MSEAKPGPKPQQRPSEPHPAAPPTPTPKAPEAAAPLAPDPDDALAPDEESSASLEGIDIDILEDGTVRLHAACRPGEDPADCARRVRFLVDALGIPLESVVTEVGPPPPSPPAN